jgi:glyoxylase-like metal-dependent hydrolase (beta-lactamase superfamily II)
VDFWGLYKGDLWRDHGDGYQITPGVQVLRTPGHTEEDASLMVETAAGIYVLTHLLEWKGGMP